MDEQTGEEIIEDSSENGEICIKQKTESDFISNLLQNVHNASFVLLWRKIAVCVRAVAGSRDSRMSGVGVVPLRSAQMTGPPPPPHTPQKEFQLRHTFLLSRSVGLACPIEPVARS